MTYLVSKVYCLLSVCYFEAVNELSLPSFLTGGGGTPLYGLYGDMPLDRVWLQDCRRVFGNPKSETLVCIYFSEQCFTSIEFPLKVHRC